MTNPLVTVVIPAYNSRDTISRALESVLEQEYSPLEIIVVDDCSTDDTVQSISHYAGSLRVVRVRVNGGAAHARNVGIEQAGGKYIAFLDADDAWLPGKILQQVGLIEGNPRISVVTCDSEFISPDGVVFKRSHLQHPPVAGGDAWKALLAHNFIPTPTVLARREDIVQVGGFDPRLPVGEDLDLWLRLAVQGEVAVIDQVLVRIYDLPGSLMKSDPYSELTTSLPMLLKHVDLLESRLGDAEARDIRGRLHYDVGCNLLWRGAGQKSTPLFVSALRYRYRRLRCLFLIFKSLVYQVGRRR